MTPGPRVKASTTAFWEAVTACVAPRRLAHLLSLPVKSLSDAGYTLLYWAVFLMRLKLVQQLVDVGVCVRIGYYAHNPCATWSLADVRRQPRASAPRNTVFDALVWQFGSAPDTCRRVLWSAGAYPTNMGCFKVADTDVLELQRRWRAWHGHSRAGKRLWLAVTTATTIADTFAHFIIPARPP
jgi:hypothetical protein